MKDSCEFDIGKTGCRKRHPVLCLFRVFSPIAHCLCQLFKFAVAVFVIAEAALFLDQRKQLAVNHDNMLLSQSGDSIFVVDFLRQNVHSEPVACSHPYNPQIEDLLRFPFLANRLIRPATGAETQ